MSRGDKKTKGRARVVVVTRDAGTRGEPGSVGAHVHVGSHDGRESGKGQRVAGDSVRVCLAVSRG